MKFGSRTDFLLFENNKQLNNNPLRSESGGGTTVRQVTAYRDAAAVPSGRGLHHYRTQKHLSSKAKNLSQNPHTPSSTKFDLNSSSSKASKNPSSDIFDVTDTVVTKFLEAKC